MDSFSLMQRNFRNLYADAFWFGVLSGTTVAFLAIFAARLGASSFQIGLLTAGPALVNLAVSLPAARWMERRSLIEVSFWSAVLSRVGYFALILLPWIFNQHGQVRSMIWITLYISLPATLWVIGFNALFAEAVPSQYRAEVVGKRNALLAISMTIATLLSGLLLERITFPLNYQAVFGLGALGAALSAYHLALLRPAPRSPLPRTNGLGLGGVAQFRSLLRKVEQLPLGGGTALRSFLHLDLLRGRLGSFMAAYLLVYTFQYLCIPIFPLVYVADLKLSDGMISLGSGLFYAMMFLVSLRLKWLAARFSHHQLLTAAAIGLASYPLIMGLARGPGLYLVGSITGGVVYAVLSASLVNRLMEVVPEQERAAGMAFHNLALNLGILAGSLTGPLLGGWLGNQEGLMLGAGLRLFAGLLMIWWG